MSKGTKHNHEPLIHITKRGNVSEGKAWGIRILSIVFSLLVCSVVIILLTHYNPIQVFKAMVTGNFGSLTKVRSLFQNLAMLHYPKQIDLPCQYPKLHIKQSMHIAKLWPL